MYESYGLQYFYDTFMVLFFNKNMYFQYVYCFFFCFFLSPIVLYGNHMGLE